MLRDLFSYGWWMLILIPLRLLALVVHECSHGWVSTKLGDPTPRIRGRLTLNPLVHLDFMGTVLMLLTGFGWARPVEVNPMYYKDRKKGMALVAAAGPLSNFLLALISLLVFFIVLVISSFVNSVELYKVLNVIMVACDYSATINLCFMVFNLIPIPPLDGSRILGMFVGDRLYYQMLQFERYSMILIMVLSLTGVFSSIIGTGVSFFYNGIMNVLVRVFGLFLG